MTHNVQGDGMVRNVGNYGIVRNVKSDAVAQNGVFGGEVRSPPPTMTAVTTTIALFTPL